MARTCAPEKKSRSARAALRTAASDSSGSSEVPSVMLLFVMPCIVLGCAGCDDELGGAAS